MNNTRWLLLVPLLISFICLIGSIYLTMLGRIAVSDPFSEEKFLKWHEEAISSEEPQLLRHHSKQLWNQLLITHDLANVYIDTLKMGFSTTIYLSSTVLVFCSASFVTSKNLTKTTT
jgi:arginine exporter protein ArgO